jgi:hypothetical protein
LAATRRHGAQAYPFGAPLVSVPLAAQRGRSSKGSLAALRLTSRSDLRAWADRVSQAPAVQGKPQRPARLRL